MPVPSAVSPAAPAWMIWASVTCCRDAVVLRDPADGRRIGYDLRRRGQVAEIVIVAGAVDGDGHQLCGAVYGVHREGVGQRVVDVERPHRVFVSSSV